MPHESGKYARLQSAAADDSTDDNLGLTGPRDARPRQLFMPSAVHAALNRAAVYADSEADTDSDDEVLDNDSDETLADSVEKKPISNIIKGKLDVDDAEQGRPAWTKRRGRKEDVLRNRMLLPTVAILLLVLLAAFFAGHSAVSVRSSAYAGKKKLVSLEDVLYGKFGVEESSIDWLAEAGDGVYSYRSPDGSIMLHDIGKNVTSMLVKHADVRGEMGVQLDWQTFSVSHDMRYILFSVDRDKLWRWSSRSNFFVHNIAEKTTTPLTQTSVPSLTAIAQWAPQGHSIAFVKENDLYVSPLDDLGSPVRVTSNGNETIFNGIPDWVYEEEVFGSDSAVWWCPDGRKLAFLSFDESEVHQYRFPIYNKDRFSPGADSYPSETVMRYPKPNTPNPKVTLYAFDLDVYQSTNSASTATYLLQTVDPLDIHDRIITEVAWVSDDDLMIRETDRSAARERIAHFSFAKLQDFNGPASGVVTRDVNWVERDGGWAEAVQTIQGIQSLRQSKSNVSGAADIPHGYLDVVPDANGYNHIAIFSPPDSPSPVFLTTGNWEVDGKIHAVDVQRRVIYFIAANPSVERHVYSIALPTQSEIETLRKTRKPGAPISLTDASQVGYYDASFSPEGGFYLLNQRAGLPWQSLVNIRSGAYELMKDNARLNDTLAEFAMPTRGIKQYRVNNVSVNVAEVLPPNLDVSGNTQYPVLLRPYGGPNSQTASQRFTVGFGDFLSSSLGYIILEIDGRGTGYRGRAFRSVIRGNLGDAEAQDQIAVAEEYAKLPYVDEKRIGIQGWSYGGYLTSKVIEANSSIISLGIAVAPVTDWRYYDTIYAERYMSTYQTNLAGYIKSAVIKMEGFKHAAFMLAHGSGDDNVHYLNSAALLDRLTFAGVRNYRYRMYTDSAHNMGVRNAYVQLHHTMTDFLEEHLGKARRTKHHAEDR